MHVKNKEHLGLLLGFIAVSCFGLTLPMTRLAVTELDPIFVGFGRALAASVIAAFILWIQRAPRPSKEQYASIIIVGLCISILFPVLVAYAMRFLPSSHGAIVIGLLPMTTAYCVSRMNHEQPSPAFWWASALGGGTVVGYALMRSGGAVHPADILLLLTVVAGSLGYAHGAVLAKTMGGLRVMCWALVCMMPVLALVALPQLLRIHCSAVSFPVWAAFVYLTLISQLFGMGLWYKALSLGSVLRVSQMQLLQPFMTILFAGLLFGEHIDAVTWTAAAVVVFSIQLSRKAQVSLNH